MNRTRNSGQTSKKGVDKINAANTYWQMEKAIDTFMATCPMHLKMPKPHAWKNAFKGAGAYYSAFLLHFLSSPFVKMQYERLSNQGVVSNLNKELVKSVDVYIPALPEQQKITDFFNAVDKQIEVEEKRLETMKNIKKGLLQQMFI